MKLTTHYDPRRTALPKELIYSLSRHITLRVRRLPQLPRPSKHLAQNPKFAHQLPGRSHHFLPRRGLAVGLDAKLDGGNLRVRHLIGGEEDVFRFEQLGAEEVTEGVVLCCKGEERGGRAAWDGSLGNFFGAGGDEDFLKGVGDVHDGGAVCFDGGGVRFSGGVGETKRCKEMPVKVIAFMGHDREWQNSVNKGIVENSMSSC